MTAAGIVTDEKLGIDARIDWLEEIGHYGSSSPKIALIPISLMLQISYSLGLGLPLLSLIGMNAANSPLEEFYWIWWK